MKNSNKMIIFKLISVGFKKKKKLESGCSKFYFKGVKKILSSYIILFWGVCNMVDAVCTLEL